MPFWSRPPTSSPSNSIPTNPSSSDKDDKALEELLSALDEESAKADTAAKKHVAYNEEGDPNFKSGFEDTMNCLTAFDDMYYCYSLGGQWANVYRYGELRDCSEKSADWRFCMRTKTVGPIAKKAMIQARNKEKAAKLKAQPNSEDIWKLRKTPLKNPFSGSKEDLERDSLS